ncbi:MAG: cobalamin-binding protein [Gemmatimonadales bacterium]
MTLLPAATEMVAALGGADQLVGISHECDFPPTLGEIPRVTTTPIDPTAPSATIDAEVRALREAGRPVIAVDAALLQRLAPDLIVTQDLCEVCAVAGGEVHRLASALPRQPVVLSLSGRTLEGVWEDLRRVSRALGREDEGNALLARLVGRLERLASRAPPHRPRTVCVEWLDPPFLAGHWIPELVEAAGGRDVGARPGAHSMRTTWRDVVALRPDLVIVMLCGFGVERSVVELQELLDAEGRRLLSNAPTWVMDGNAYTSRPGPRLVDGAERLQSAMLGREMDGLVRWRPSA